MAGVVEEGSNALCWSVGLCSRLVVFDWVSNAASSWSLIAALVDWGHCWAGCFSWSVPFLAWKVVAASSLLLLVDFPAGC